VGREARPLLALPAGPALSALGGYAPAALDVVRRSRSAGERIVEQGDREPAGSCRVGDDGVSGDPVLAEREGKDYAQPPTRGYDDAVDEWLLGYGGSPAERDASFITAPAPRISAGLPGGSVAGLPGGSHRVPGPRAARDVPAACGRQESMSEPPLRA
jgi:hypothetical protein